MATSLCALVTAVTEPAAVSTASFAGMGVHDLRDDKVTVEQLDAKKQERPVDADLSLIHISEPTRPY